MRETPGPFFTCGDGLGRWEAGGFDAVCDPLELVVCHRNGEWRWLLSRDTVFSRTSDGRIKELLGTATDITEHKRAQTALHESEERWQLALRGNNDGIWDHD